MDRIQWAKMKLMSELENAPQLSQNIRSCSYEEVLFDGWGNSKG